jgi:hypothetical protein
MAGDNLVVPITLDDFAKAAKVCDEWNRRFSLAEPTRRTAARNIPEEQGARPRRIRLGIERKLAAAFPLIGAGTEVNVFDSGTCVLKVRVPSANGWDLAGEARFGRPERKSRAASATWPR